MDDEEDFRMPDFGVSANRAKPHRRPMTFTTASLNKLLGELAWDIVTKLGGEESGLANVLKREDMSVDMIKALVAVLGKACDCESMPAYLNSIIIMLLHSRFIERTLFQFLTQISMKGQGGDDVVNSVVPFLIEMLKKMPAEGIPQVQLVAVTLQNIWQQGNMMDESLNMKMTKVMELLSHSKPPPLGLDPRSRDQLPAEREPPESFRELPVIPTKSELDGTSDVFILPNKLEGGFRDLEHYLECQFRLFRADYILPLRESIVSLQSSTTEPGFKVYHDVHLIRPVCSQNGMTYRVAFDISALQRVDWGSSRRLIFGSLLCLSSDNFNEDIHFASVDQREEKNLRLGLVDIIFLSDDTDASSIPRDRRFTMVESPAYFESYKYVLEGMQQLTERNVPFQKYIVECKHEVDAPAYITQQEDVTYDLRPLADDDFEVSETSTNIQFPSRLDFAQDVHILDPASWPMPETLQLDRSQLEAIKSALTKEFVLIQGPPGTGKTHVGVKIMKALLYNKKIWLQEQEQVPILVVCYTNHALDQFLEGVLKFYRGSLTRVGTRSKSDQLAEYSLRDKRKRARDMRQVPGHVYTERIAVMRDMEKVKLAIHDTAAKLEVAEREIVHEDTLKDFMDGKDKQLVSGRGCQILHWLGIAKQLHDIESEEEYLYHQREEIRKEEDNDDESDDSSDEDSDSIDTALGAYSRQLDVGNDVEDIEELSDLLRILRDLDKTNESLRTTYIGLNVTDFESLAASQDTKSKRRKLQLNILKKINSADKMLEDQASKIPNIWRIPFKERWRLYRYWVDLLCKQARGEIRDKEVQYKELASRYKDLLHQEDRVILANSSILGMTTTAAARYQRILNEIGPKIIVVEEAAEVLEAHVIGTLSRRCQHLILIGDHKQLRPNPTVHELAKKYNLEISLFERMVTNKIHCDTLLWQHRMRPEISSVIHPIYPKLKDHEMVMAYASVRGVASNVFFINHSHPHTFNEETLSYCNEFEADMLAQFCNYLLKQGYFQSQITILTPYSAQVNKLKNYMDKKTSDVRVVAVDSYQGEENDIVLLSLVRSGEENSIGFLKADNRICVALSRAKVGMYVIGNFSYITEYSPLLKTICANAAKRKIIGPYLTLSKCQQHPQSEGTCIKTPQDFLKAPGGGCSEQCDYRLPCGHVCPRICHMFDREHNNVQCYEPCRRKCKDCNEYHCAHDCYKPCPPCSVLLPKSLPRCGHQQGVPGHEDVTFVQCQQPCEEILPCDHKCTGLCGQPHPPCTEKVSVTKPCTHTISLPCHEKNSAPCNHPCSTVLCCEHYCQGNCNSCGQGRLHCPCTSPCQRILICGHACKSSCGNCPPCSRPCENRCSHSRCPQQCGELCVSCRMPCQWKCRHYTCKTPCGDQCDRPRCDAPCRKKLPCSHTCIGLCGEPCPKLCRICDDDKVTEVFLGSEGDVNALFVELEDCGHIFEFHDLDTYMDSPVVEDENKSLIKLKGCPRCSTAIRRSLRYGNIIKQALDDVEKVKRKVLGNEDRVNTLKESVTRLKQRFHQREIQDLPAIVPSEVGLTTQLNQLKLLREAFGLDRTVKESISRFRSDAYGVLQAHVEVLKRWIMTGRCSFGVQEINDCKRELERLSLMRNLIDARGWIEFDKAEPAARIMRALVNTIRRLETGKILSDEELEEAVQVKTDVAAFVPGSGIGVTDEERFEIVEAIGLNKGHWYKCPRGHPYAIGECGRAFEEAVCPECKSAIGGQNHVLTEGNAWAPEMDEAEGPAWSEDADLLLALRLHHEWNG